MRICDTGFENLCTRTMSIEQLVEKYSLIHSAVCMTFPSGLFHSSLDFSLRVIFFYNSMLGFFFFRELMSRKTKHFERNFFLFDFTALKLGNERIDDLDFFLF